MPPTPLPTPSPTPSSGRQPGALSAASAREVLVVQAFEADGDSTPMWTAEDRSWATRLARETAPAGQLAAFVVERARHALQRLAAREPAIPRWLAQRGWDGRWSAALLVASALLGVLADHIGASQRINLLAPPVWLLVVWNGLVYVVLLLHTLGLQPPGWGATLRRALQRLWHERAPAMRGSANTATLLAFRSAWLRHSGPSSNARAASLLHGAAAALAAGMVLGLYLRGLVLDYRAGWQSTFLDATQVQAALNLLLDPASRFSGIAVPAVAALQVLPEAAPVGLAAPWLHLYATTLAAAVIVPRCSLAVLAAWRARRLAATITLPWHELYFQRLVAAAANVPMRVSVWPHGASWPPAANEPVRALLQRHFGTELDLRFEAPTAYGEEDAAPPAPFGQTNVVLCDLASTPEAETHGRFIGHFKRSGVSGAAGVVMVLTDEAAFAQRFATMPERLAQRRSTWHNFCNECGAVWLSACLRDGHAAS